jgi:hypothetical protein
LIVVVLVVVVGIAIGKIHVPGVVGAILRKLQPQLTLQMSVTYYESEHAGSVHLPFFS